MLIHSIKARNFMRFERLEISGLPPRGLIGIEGPNESGKSTVGEALLFGFFGRTRLLCEFPIASLIRWGTDSMSVEVEFSVEPAVGDGVLADGGSRFLAYRQIDAHGSQYVKLLELPGRKELACGALQVADALTRLLRFGYEEFQQSFYYDQDEPRKAQAAQVAFFEAATGVRHLRAAISELEREKQPLERQHAYFQKEIGRNLAQIEKHERNAAKLPDLTARAQKLEESINAQAKEASEVRRKVEALRAEAGVLEGRVKRHEQLPDADLEALQSELERQPGGTGDVERIRAAASDLVDLLKTAREEVVQCSRHLGDGTEGGYLAEQARVERDATALKRSVRAWNRVMAVGFLVLLGSIFVVYVAPGWGLRSVVVGTAPSPDWRVLAAAGCAVLGLILGILAFFKVLRRKRRIRELEANRSRLEQEIESSRITESSLLALIALKSVRDVPKLIELAVSAQAVHTPLRAADLRRKYPDLLGGEAGPGLSQFLAARVKEGRDARSRLLGEAQRIEKAAQEEEAALRKLEADRERLESEIRECQFQAAKKADLESKNHDLAGNAAVIRMEIELRRVAGDLLDETVKSIRTKVGPSLTRLVKAVLPGISSGRYRDLRVESDLSFKVFSSEKNEFLSLRELSGGTNEALCLALRLAIAHAFAATRSCQAHFLFLDEPFKMMDASRAAQTLGLLPCLSPQLRQFFVLRPDFTPQERDLLACAVRTSRETPELVVAFSTAGGDGRIEGCASLGPGEPSGHDPSPHVVQA